MKPKGPSVKSCIFFGIFFVVLVGGVYYGVKNLMEDDVNVVHVIDSLPGPTTSAFVKVTGPEEVNISVYCVSRYTDYKGVSFNLTAFRSAGTDRMHASDERTAYDFQVPRYFPSNIVDNIYTKNFTTAFQHTYGKENDLMAIDKFDCTVDRLQFNLDVVDYRQGEVFDRKVVPVVIDELQLHCPEIEYVLAHIPPNVLGDYAQCRELSDGVLDHYRWGAGAKIGEAVSKAYPGLSNYVWG